MSQLSIQVLGTPRIVLEDQAIDLGRRKALALLIYLAVTKEPHRRDRLSAFLWPDSDQGRAYAYLRQALWEIKRTLGDKWIQARRETVAISPKAAIEVDVNEFQKDFNSLLEHQHAPTQFCDECIPTLLRAMARYRGEFLEGFGLRDSPEFDDWQFFQSEALRRQFASGLQKLIQAYKAEGNLEKSVDYAQRWLSLDHLNETAHRELMSLYVLSGERAAAQRQYQDCSRIFKKELGVAPEAQTQELYQQIQSGAIHSIDNAMSLAQAQLPISPITELVQSFQLGGTYDNLPSYFTSFVGRRRELEEIRRLLQNPACRVLTLLGPGGIGKTRLAIQAADELKSSFQHGILFVPLAPLDTAQSIIPAVADALGIAYRQDDLQLKEQLLRHLHEKELLLVIDNFEHLIDGANILSEIIDHAAGAKMLVTSRQRLNLSWEWTMEVSGMRFPTPSSVVAMSIAEQPNQSKDVLEHYSAVEMFLESARRSRVDFVITPEAYPAVVRITQLVNGMPLGLELAAPWVNMLSCEEIATEIERNLDFLESALQDVPERQHSIRAVFDHSWKLLSENERQVFSQFSIFHNGFTRQAVQEVTGVSTRVLMSLIDKSLLRRGNDGRFEMHELLRQYASEKLTQTPDLKKYVGEHYCRYYSAAMQNWEKALKGPQQREALVEVQLDLQNVVAAWRWVASNQQVHLLEPMIEGLNLYYVGQKRYDEGLEACRFAVTQLGDQSSALGRRTLAYLLVWYALFQSYSGDSEASQESYQRSEAILDSLDINQTWFQRAGLLRGKGSLIFYLFGDEHGCDLIEESLSIYREHNDLWGESEVLTELGWIAKSQHLFDKAHQAWDQAQAIKRQIGDQLGLAIVLLEQALQVGFGIGNLHQAEALLRESNQILAQLGDQASFVRILENMDHIYITNGRFEDALDIRQEKLAYYKTLGNCYHLGMAYAHLCEVYQMLGDYKRSIQEGSAALEALEGASYSFEHSFASWLLGLTYLATGDLQQSRRLFEWSQSIHEQMHRPDGVGCLLVSTARIDFAMGDNMAAWRHVIQGLEKLLKHKNFLWALYGVASISLLLAQDGQLERAASLYALINAQPFAANSRWFRDVYGQPIHNITQTLAKDALSSAQARGREMELWATVAALLNEFGD
jgi:DNA-binding SARP family transcriptional activator/predicted ATPase